jgi:hypothetical protein
MDQNKFCLKPSRHRSGDVHRFHRHRGEISSAYDRSSVSLLFHVVFKVFDPFGQRRLAIAATRASPGWDTILVAELQDFVPFLNLRGDDGRFAVYRYA